MCSMSFCSTIRPLSIDVGIGEIHRQRGIVVPQIRTQQQRLHFVKHQFKSRQIAGVRIEQAIGSAGGSADVAMAVEHDKRIVMLE